MAETANPQPFSNLQSISTIDGRFRAVAEDVSHYFSEEAIMKNRILVEVEWLIELSKNGIFRKFSAKEIKILQNLYKQFSEKDAHEIWDIDLRINHDTKAHELFIAGKIEKTSLKDVINYIHFGLTSTDVDNSAFALSFKGFLENIFYPTTNNLLLQLVELAKLHKTTVMLGRTHGVPALPTTAGKELVNFAVDIKNELSVLLATPISIKISGAIGNRSELAIAVPNKNWKKITDAFITRLGFVPQSHSTQIEQHSNKIHIFDLISQVARIGAKLAQDLWLYNSLGYLSWRDNSGHVGSSVMPHKINPIGAELAQTYFITGAETLHTITNIIMENRMQRDLRDKYALRKTGEACAEIILALDGLTKSLQQIGFNKERLQDELNQHWEVLSASIQTILRVEGTQNPYDLLKKLSRGTTWRQAEYKKVVESLPVNEKIKTYLAKLSPESITGEAIELTTEGIAQVTSYLKLYK